MMDALEFIKQKTRMCNTYDDFCSDCPMKRPGERCGDFVEEHPEEAISIVEQWAEKHPPKTRQSKFLKIFSKAFICSGAINICPMNIEPMDVCDDLRTNCTACRQAYWLSEVSEDDSYWLSKVSEDIGE